MAKDDKMTTALTMVLVRTLKVAAQPAVITSKEYFEEAGVYRIGDDFQSEFFGLEIAEVPETELAVRRLVEASLDAPILAKFGGKAEVPVSQFKVFLIENRESPEWFIFYLRGRGGHLWAVGARWRVGYGGWCTDASSIADPRGWGAGDHVVSCHQLFDSPPKAKKTL